MKVDIAIMTIREDEFTAVRRRFKTERQRIPSGRTYLIGNVKTEKQTYTIAIARCSDQGNDASQRLAHYIIQNLDPQLILVVGIAGAIPHDEFTLGDVVVSTHIVNPNVDAWQADGTTNYMTRGGPPHPLVEDIVSLLPGDPQLEGWADSIRTERPRLDPEQASITGDDEWCKKVRESLNWHFGEAQNRGRPPTFTVGPILSSNHLMKDPARLREILKTHRSILAVEMEIAGVYEAAQGIDHQYPVMAIRGISDIVGLQRESRWTEYACQTAAAFTYAFIMTDPLDPPLNSASFQKPVAPSEISSAQLRGTEQSLDTSHSVWHPFCQRQVNNYMEPLKGSKDDRDKKYIEELYQVRKKVASLLDTFVQSNSTSFVTIGDSGSGKSCWICHSALTYLEQGYATFFYRGSDIEEGIFNAISQDLNWSFSPQYDEIQGIKRLLEIFRQSTVLIFVDGLDEMPLHTARKILTQFVKRAEGTKAKLIATCKTDTWVKLLEHDSVPTPLALKVFRTDEGKGYQLSEFDDQEFFYMLEKYRAFYQYFGGFDSDVYEACKQNPFLLRIMFEVAADQRWDYISYAAIDFYKAYFRKLSSRFEQKEVIQRVLTNIARTLYVHNAEELEFEVLAIELRLSTTESIPERLFELNVLERADRDNTTYLGFYFKKLRDYLIAFRALKWQNFSPEDFQSEIEKREVSGVRLDALNLYYSLASDEHKRVLDSLLYDNAQKYVHLYQEILDNNFPSFKSAFPPYTAGAIGFIGYLDLSKRVITYHGFRPIKETDKTVFFFPRSIQQNDGGLAYRVYRYGPLQWRGTNGFRTLNITKEVIWEEVKPYLEGIIEHGGLDESLNKNLLIERVLVTCLRYYKDYFQVQQQDPAASYLPLDLRKLKEFVLYKIAHHVLISRRLDRNEGPGTVEERWDGSIRSRNISFTFMEQTELEEQAWAIARNGEDLSNETHFNRSSDYGKFLLRDIESLARLGVTAIVSSPLTDWYNKYRSGLPLPLQWDTDSLVSLNQFVENLYVSFLQEYRTLVERNFPTLCQYFDLYSRMPLNLMVAVECENEPLPLINYPGVTVLTYTDGSQVQNTVLLSSRAEIQRKKDEIWHDPEYYARLESNSLFLHTQSYMPFEVDEQRCVLRNLVYQGVKVDLKEAFLKLAAKYGVEIYKPH